MNLFVHSRADHAVRKPLRGWSRFLATGALCLGLAACGGGGGGGDSPSTQPASGLVVTVTDTYGVPIVDATVQSTIGAATTNSNGVAALPTSGAVGDATVTVSRDTFLTKTFNNVVIEAGKVTQLPVTLERAKMPAGGSLTSRGTAPVVPDPSSMTFEIELVIVGADSQAIETLTAENFVLRSCDKDQNIDKVDCVRGPEVSFDASYSPVSPKPTMVKVAPGEPVPYAVALMLDQSNSILTSDPTGARLYSAKAFLQGLGQDDWVLLSAFANNGAKIPTPPLTVYDTFKDKISAPSYFSTLDSLAAQVGGGTPLYDALDLLRARVVNDVNDVTINPTGIAKSVVIFTDGDDTTCVKSNDLNDLTSCRRQRQDSIDAAFNDEVRIFTIGLSNNVDFVALGELANQTGGAFLFAENAEQLIPLYGSVGKLLSLSLLTYRLTWTVQATDPTEAFVSKNALIGKVDVTTDAGTFVVPFIVGIP